MQTSMTVFCYQITDQLDDISLLFEVVWQLIWINEQKETFQLEETDTSSFEWIHTEKLMPGASFHLEDAHMMSVYT